MQYLTAGESHGRGLVGILEGMPAGVPIDADYTAREMARRMSGYGRGGRMKIETDAVEFWSGVRGGVTLGSPIALVIPNRDYANWQQIMGAFEADTQARTLTAVRPGHADHAGCVKYGFSDARNVLERASARQTAVRVAIGSVCKQLLEAVGVTVASYVTEIAGISTDYRADSAVGLNALSDASPVRCPDLAAAKAMMQKIDDCKAAGDTAGGCVRVMASGMPIGVGSHVEYYRKLDYVLSGHLMSLQAVKAVEIGMGARLSSVTGLHAHDCMYPDDKGGIMRKTNRAGGIEGGMTNGENIVLSCTVKPIPTLMAGLETVDIRSGAATRSAPERSDVCAVPAAGVVAENIVAYVLADALLKTFGGDTLQELRERVEKRR